MRTGGLFNVVPLVASDGMGLSAGQIGSGFALGSLFGLAATYPAGMVADRFGRKPLIVYAGVLTGVSFFGFWWLILWRSKSTVRPKPAKEDPYPKPRWRGAGGDL